MSFPPDYIEPSLEDEEPREAPELPKDDAPATIEIDWHASDVCLTLNCTCGHSNHFDAPYIDSATCARCGLVYTLPREYELGEAK